MAKTKTRKPARSAAGKGARARGGKPGRAERPKAPHAAARGKGGKAGARKIFHKGSPKPTQQPRLAGTAARRPRGARAEVVAPPAVLRPENDESRERALAAVKAGFDKKAEDAVVLDVRGLSGVADYFVLLSADSDRQAGAIADAIETPLEELGAIRLGVEGRSGGGWVLLDFGDVVVHVMDPETRKFYDLEGLWADAPRVKV
jgi:ribosome-associated protein